jgi:proteasome lid subunit RPN8/RPN11
LIISATISQQHLHELERFAKVSYPAEACALLEGNFTKITDKVSKYRYDQANVVDIVHMHNSDDSIYSFRIDSNELINAYQEISSRNRDLVGIFHSHSSKAYPSSTDRKYMELNPVVWLIYSTLSRSFAAYTLDDDKIAQIKIESSSL